MLLEASGTTLDFEATWAGHLMFIVAVPLVAGEAVLVERDPPHPITSATKISSVAKQNSLRFTKNTSP